jgi:hypothetical protein
MHHREVHTEQMQSKRVKLLQYDERRLKGTRKPGRSRRTVSKAGDVLLWHPDLGAEWFLANSQQADLGMSTRRNLVWGQPHFRANLFSAGWW